MNSTLTPELFWLTLVTLLTSVMWVPYIINWIAENGVVDALWRPMNFDHSQPRARWAVRMLRATPVTIWLQRGIIAQRPAGQEHVDVGVRLRQGFLVRRVDRSISVVLGKIIYRLPVDVENCHRHAVLG